MLYNTLLKTTASEDILNIPTDALFLPQNILDALYTRIVADTQSTRPKFSTVGSLLKEGRIGLLKYFSEIRYSLEESNKILDELEQALAVLGLKFKDSNFTVGDVKVEKLDCFFDYAYAFYKCSDKIKTLDDLVIYGRAALTPKLRGTRRDLSKIADSLANFGLKIEDFSHKVDLEHTFDLTKYQQYLTEETKNARCKSYRKTVKVENSIENLSSSELLEEIKKDLTTLPSKLPMLNYSILPRHNKDVIDEYTLDQFGFNEYITEYFKKLDVKTMSDLIFLGKKRINRLISDSKDFYLFVRKSLAKYGMDLLNDEHGIIIAHDNVVSMRENEIVSLGDNVLTIDGEERERLLNLPLHEVGFVDETVERLAKLGVKKVIDLPKLTMVDIYNCCNNDSFRQCVSKADLGVLMSRVNKLIERNDVEEFILKHDRGEELSCEEKEKLLNTPVDRLGITAYSIVKLKNFGFFNLEDICTIRNISTYDGFISRYSSAHNRVLKLCEISGKPIGKQIVYESSGDYLEKDSSQSPDKKARPQKSFTIKPNKGAVFISPPETDRHNKRPSSHSNLQNGGSKRASMKSYLDGLVRKDADEKAKEIAELLEAKKNREFNVDLRKVKKMAGEKAKSFKILESEISLLPVSDMTVEALRNNGIITCRQFLSCDNKVLEKIFTSTNMNDYKTICSVLDSYGFSKFVKKARQSGQTDKANALEKTAVAKTPTKKRKYSTSRKDRSVVYDITVNSFMQKLRDATEEQREELEKTQITTLPFKKEIVAALNERGYFVLSDLKKISEADIDAVCQNKYNKNKFNKMLIALGYKPNGHVYASEIKNVDFENLTDTERERLTNLPVIDLGFRKAQTERMLSAGYKSLKDFQGINAEELTKIFGGRNSPYYRMVEILLGLNIADLDRRPFQERGKRINCENGDLKYVSFPKYCENLTKLIEGKTKEEQEELFSQISIDNIPINNFVKAKLRERGLLTLADLKYFPQVKASDIFEKKENFVMLLNDVLTILGYKIGKNGYTGILDIVDYASLNEEEKQKILSLEIENLALSKRFCLKLRNAGFKTIEDFSKISSKDFKKIYGKKYRCTKAYTPEVKSALMTLRGYIDKKVTFNSFVDEFKTLVENSTEEERKKMLGKTLEELEFPVHLVNKFNSINVTTLQELINMQKKDIYNLILNSKTKKLLDTLAMLGQDGRKIAYDKQKMLNFVNSYKGATPESIPQEKLDEIKEISLDNFIIYDDVLKRLRERGVYKIKDFGKITKTDFRAIVGKMSKIVVSFINCCETNLGVNFYKSLGRIISNKDKIEISNKTRILNEPISRKLGFSKVQLEKAVGYGVETLGDFAKLSGEQFVDVFYKRKDLIDDYIQKFKQLGIDINIGLVLNYNADKFDASELSEEEREQISNTPLEKIDISNTVLEMFHDCGCNTIGDLANLSHGKLLICCSNNSKKAKFISDIVALTGKKIEKTGKGNRTPRKKKQSTQLNERENSVEVEKLVIEPEIKEAESYVANEPANEVAEEEQATKASEAELGVILGEQSLIDALNRYGVRAIENISSDWLNQSPQNLSIVDLAISNYFTKALLASLQKATSEKAFDMIAEENERSKQQAFEKVRSLIKENKEVNQEKENAFVKTDKENPDDESEDEK